MYGPKPMVTDYTVGQVMLVLSLSHNEGMLDYWTGHHYSKIMEGKARSKAGKR